METPPHSTLQNFFVVIAEYQNETKCLRLSLIGRQFWKCAKKNLDIF